MNLIPGYIHKVIITDSQNRTFKTLRISLTNSCNLACTYCVNDEVVRNSTLKIESLNVDEISIIAQKLHQILNLETIRLTGGEPTLYQDIVPLIKSLRNIGTELKLTTNGFLLKNLVDKLAIGDINSINVSLDALDEDVFFQISRRRSVHKIIEGIDAALRKGINVKLNCVVIKGLNENEILPLMQFSKERNITIRFLELMKMGHVFNSDFSKFYSQEAILNTISSKYTFAALEREEASTANYWQTSEGQIFGIIANESSPFCNDCNRLRLDQQGNIYGCLSNPEGINIRNDLKNDELLIQKLSLALAQKQALKFKGSALSMIEIGG